MTQQNDLIQLPAGVNLEFLSLQKKPEQVLDDAKRVAAALMQVLALNPKPFVINGERYLEIDDWTTVGHFYGVTAEIEWTRPLDLFGARGFEAKARLIHTATGKQVSQAESMCMDDEERWSARPKYVQMYVCKDGSRSVEEPARDQMVWIDNPAKPGKKMPQREKVRSEHDEKVPWAQIRSMAQTRACVKALRIALSWVVVMAGYKGTPAEELTGNEESLNRDTGELTEKAKPLEAPKKKATAAGKAPDGAKLVRVKLTARRSAKTGSSNGNPWVKYAFKGSDKQEYHLFDNKAELMQVAEDAMAAGDEVDVHFTTGNYGNDIVALAIVEKAEPQAETKAAEATAATEPASKA